METNDADARSLLCMKRLCNRYLAHPGLAQNHDGQASVRDAPYEIEDIAHDSALADERTQGEHLAERGCKSRAVFCRTRCSSARMKYRSSSAGLKGLIR